MIGKTTIPAKDDLYGGIKFGPTGRIEIAENHVSEPCHTSQRGCKF